MLELDSKLTLNEATMSASNLTGKFSDEDLRRLGEWCHAGYMKDRQSRSRWETRTEAAMDLAMQLQKTKTFPWQGASNIAFPLVTIAVMQFHARAYPTIVQGSDVARTRVIGGDPDGSRRKRADRISTYMSWQCLEEDKAWEEQWDRTLINVPCVGTAFMKDYYNPTLGYPVSELVLAKDLVLAYKSKSVDTAPRKTQIISLARNEIYERVQRGTYRDILEEAWYKAPPPQTLTTAQIAANTRQGVTQSQPDELTDFVGLEQHVSVDLDQDGYAEPYIITLEESSKSVLRIVCRFDREADIERVARGDQKGQIVRIHATEYFTKIPFIPSPDGGIYDVGFGVLLGPLNESVSSIVNQLVDSGTMANTAGGFLGRGAKIRGGVYTFTPFGWNRVDSTGDDLKKSIFPLPVREPSTVLFQLLSFIVGYTERISGAVEATTGENPGQNTPAQTFQTMVTQGEKIFAGIYKRIWRSMKGSFGKRFVLNALFMPQKVDFGGGFMAMREDFTQTKPDSVVPVADPHFESEQMRLQKALTLRDLSSSMPGYNREVVERRVLSAMRVDGIDEVFVGVQKTGPLPNPKVQVEEMKAQAAMQVATLRAKNELQKLAMQLMSTQDLNMAKIVELKAKAALEMEEAGGVKEGHAIAAFEAQVGALKQHNDALNTQIEMVLGHVQEMTKAQQGGEDGTASNGSGVQGMAAAPGNALAPAMA